MTGTGCGSSLALCEKIFWAQHTFLGGYASGDKCSVCLSQQYLCRARKSSCLEAGEGSSTLLYELFLIVSISLTIGLEVICIFKCICGAFKVLGDLYSVLSVNPYR